MFIILSMKLKNKRLSVVLKDQRSDTCSIQGEYSYSVMRLDMTLRFMMQALQDPPLCRNTVQRTIAFFYICIKSQISSTAVQNHSVSQCYVQLVEEKHVICWPGTMGTNIISVKVPTSISIHIYSTSRFPPPTQSPFSSQSISPSLLLRLFDSNM